LDHTPAAQETETDHRSERFDAVFLVQLALILSLFAFICILRASMVPGFTRAESCFAEGAREMFVNRQFVAPLLDNILYFDKPPLFYWFLIGAYQVFGVSLFCARAVSILLALASVAATAIFTRAYASSKVAILTAAVLCTNFCFFEFASVAMPDMLLCLCEVISIFALYSLTRSGDRVRTLWAAIAGAAIALGWLTKGPIALLIVGTAFGIFLLMFKMLPILRKQDIVIAVATFFAILIPWHLFLYRDYGLPAFDWLYMKGMFGRYLGVHQYYNFGHSVTYIASSLMSGFLPWSLFLAPALWVLPREIKRQPQSQENRLLALMIIWATVNTVFFSFSNSNWGYYSLPIFPATALITAYFLNRCAEQVSRPMQVFTLCLSIVLPLVGFYFIPKATAYLGVTSSSYDLAGKILLLACTLVLCYLFAKKHFYIGFCSIGIIFAISMFIYAGIFLPVKAHNDEYLHLVQKVKDLAPDNQFFCHSDLAGQYLLFDYLNFQCGRVSEYCDNAKLLKLANSTNPALVIISERTLSTLPSSCKDHIQVLERAGFNYVDFPGCTLISESKTNHRTQLALIRIGSSK
jgi:4-amino-4-deoxy-L-arabinose transferase-like glycosyltransferase